jgi:hypothetical protein
VRICAASPSRNINKDFSLSSDFDAVMRLASMHPVHKATSLTKGIRNIKMDAAKVLSLFF